MCIILDKNTVLFVIHKDVIFYSNTESIAELIIMTVLLFSSNNVQIRDSSLKNGVKRSNVGPSLHKTNSLVLLSTLGHRTIKQRFF
jgi:hypothetical protein